MRADRLIDLVTLLRRHERLSATDLARRLGDLMPLVRRIADARTSAKYATARLWLDALRGLSPVSGTLSTCAETKVGERQGCASLLLVYGDLAVDRSAREVDLETATARELFGEGHPVYAESVVHAAEHALHHGDTDAALARAKEARAILEASAPDGRVVALDQPQSLPLVIAVSTRISAADRPIAPPQSRRPPTASCTGGTTIQVSTSTSAERAAEAQNRTCQSPDS